MESLFGIDLVTLIRAVGLLGIGAIVFSESGIFLGFFLPGDSLLFTAGFLASQDFLDIKMLLLVSVAGAILGDSVGYAFGKKVGPRLFSKEKSIIFSKENIERTRSFFEKYGGKTIIIARYLPVIRTLAPIMAGVGKMNYGQFLFYNVFGGILWVSTLGMLGYTLGRTIPDVDRYLLPIIAAIILISASPTLVHLYRMRKGKK